MARAPSGEYVTVQVRRIWTAATADNQIALVLDLAQSEPIAIELDQQKINALREKLVDAELFLSQQGGNA